MLGLACVVGVCWSAGAGFVDWITRADRVWCAGCKAFIGFAFCGGAQATKTFSNDEAGYGDRPVGPITTEAAQEQHR